MPEVSNTVLNLIILFALLLVSAIVGFAAWRIVVDNRAAAKDTAKAAETSAQAAMDTRENMLFLKALREQIGTDHGATVAKQLDDLGKAVEKARVIAEQKVRDDLVITDAARKATADFSIIVTDLRQLISGVRHDMEMYQQFTNQNAAQAARINDLSRDLHAAQIINQIHSPTTSAGQDIVNRDKTIGGDAVENDKIGGDKKVETKIKGTIKGTLTETGKE